MSSESTFVISSRDCSPIRRGSPVYCSSSLPRSTHSIPAVSSQHHTAPQNVQSKTQRTIPSKHLLDEQNRLEAAKSSEIYRSPNHKKLSNYDTNKCQNNQLYRSLNSGPSSYESGKASSMVTTSGPSSIDSGKISYCRTSGHSSLESQSSSGTTIMQQQQQQQQSPSRHHLVQQNGSPNQTPKHYQATKSKLATDSMNRVKSTSTATTTSSPTRRKPLLDENTYKPLGKPPRSGAQLAALPQSNSNSSITLQVTTSNESHIPSTKIFVQNSPIRSVITLENGKLTDKSNVVIINNETTTNSNGELIKRTISKQGSPTRVVTKWDKELQQQHCYSETEAAYETGDSLSLISETSPDSSICMVTESPQSLSQADLIENSKFTKNVNNDATMNNSRKLSLQIAHPANNIVYKNCLKDVTANGSNPTSPIKAKNCFGLESPSLVQQPFQTSGMPSHDAYYDRMASGSVGNLRYFEKNEKKLNSNCDLKALQFESPALLSKLNSNPAINTDSLAHILHKNIITVGSEPNLAMKMNECKPNGIGDQKAIDKEPMDRRFSITNAKGSGDDIYAFPSLTDLSFNFTSLAAQKILQGVSINSIDTLVELNMAQQEKQQNLIVPSAANVVSPPPAICTDYGLV